MSISPRIIPTAEPFFMPGGSTGCLLVHGFTGTPKEMRWLGEYLANQGHSVLGVRLAGHATQPEDMIRTHWEDWLACVEDGWCLLSGFTKQIFVIGLSMGAILSLCFAAHHPVAGVVVMSAPQHLPNDPRLPYIELISKVVRFQSKSPSNWYDQEASSQHISYPVNPMRSFAELRDLLSEMEKALPSVNAPTLLVYSKEDQTAKASEGHAENIYNALGSQDKRIVWIENSGHIITRDAARDQVFQVVGDFIARVRQEKG